MDPYEPEVMRHVRYALIEGWHVYRVRCLHCGHDWPKAVEPGDQQTTFHCEKCGRNAGHRYWLMALFELG